jgi:PAS domain S-box-containing protein
MTEPIRVLYVDDDPSLLDLGKIYLEITDDCSVTTLESALDAFDYLEKNLFDAIISDYQMPYMDGIDFLKKVRSLGNTIPFILFTGRGREEVVIQALNEGADFYIQKGGDPRSQFTELAHKIRQAVRQRRLEVSVRNHERREADIIDFLPDATFAINTDGIIIAWNRAMEKLTGLFSSIMVGAGNYEYALPFYHERRPLLIDLVLKDYPDISSLYPSIKRDNDHLSAEITLSHFYEGSGASFWFTASPLYDNQGTVIGAIESIREVTESKNAQEALRLDESRLEALLQLNQMISEPLQVITNFALEQAVQLTESNVGYIAFVNEDESLLTMHAWSAEAMQECQINEKPRNYPVESTGLWGESVRQRIPIITNDYAADNPLKKGIPQGHVHLIRHLSVPVFEDDHIVAVAGVGNKEKYYDSSDIRQLELLIGGMWTILVRKQAEQTIRMNHEELHAAYEELTATEEELRANLDEITRQDEIIRESERRLHSMASNIPGVVYRFIVNADGSYGFDFISDRSGEILGLENNFNTFFPMITDGIVSEDKERFISSIHHAIDTRTLWEFEGQYQKPSGETIWIKATSNPIDEHGLLIFDGVIFNITDQKIFENALMESESIYRTIFDTTGAATIIIDSDTTILKANCEFALLSGYPIEDLEGKMSWTSFVVPEDLSFMELFHRGRRDDPADQVRIYEFRFITRSGEIRYCINNVNLIPGTLRSIASVVDITDRKLAETENRKKHEELHAAYEEITATEEELRANLDELAMHELALQESKRELADIINFLPDATFAINLEGKVVAWNHAIEEMTGISAQQMIGKGNYEYGLPFYQHRRKILADLVLHDDPEIAGTYPVITKKGKYLFSEIFIPHFNEGQGSYLWFTASPLYNRAGELKGAIESIRDVTERKEAENSLASAHKNLNLLSSITRHDINNQLTTLLGYLEILESLNPDPLPHKYMLKISEIVQRISTIILFTKEYEDIGVHAPVWQDCNALINSAAKEFSSTQVIVKNDIPVGTEVFADPLIHKVCFNLVDNAVRYGGKITAIRFYTIRQGKECIVVCEDDGEGVPESEKERIFERGVGKNTGLGLFLSREILSITGLSIRECGQAGNGARFEILIPEGMFRI